MHALIVHCHPEPSSFNASLTNIAVETLRRSGYTVEVSDLYAESFDPVEKAEHYVNRENRACFSPLVEQRHACTSGTLPPDVKREISRLERADVVIIQFPLWWHTQPAMLKGWFDRVFVSGGLYTSSMRYDRGYFSGKRVMCSVTTGAPEGTFGPQSRGGNIEALLWPIHYSLYYMGFSVLPPFMAFGIQSHDFQHKDATEFSVKLGDDKAQWSARLEGINCLKPLSFPGWGDWDKDGACLVNR